MTSAQLPGSLGHSFTFIAARKAAAPACLPFILVGLLGACGQRNANAEVPPLESEPTTTRLMAQPQSALRNDPSDEMLADDNDLRRGYGAIDMRFEACVSRETDYLLKGKGCPPGILIYGPYVSVPASSQIEVSFEIESDRAMQVYADTVSQMGGQVLAGINPLVVAAGQTQKLGYFVNVPKADSNVESRIGFRSDAPVEFTISNLTMTVR